MKQNPEHLERKNQALWDELAPVHARAYRAIDLLKNEEPVLDEIELRDVGEVERKTLLHLQCHIGTDSLAWARRGALVTGVDFSPRSIALARQLQGELDLEATFICANIYDLPTVLDKQFDIVYTSRGVLCWLRDLGEWGRIIARFLKPGGIFYIMEEHPFCHTFERDDDGELRLTYPYFHSPEPRVSDDLDGDYADADYIPQHPSYEWQWSLSDIVGALLGAGLQIELFHEYERLFFKLFSGMVEGPARWYRLPEHAGKLPLLFTLRARKVDRPSDI